MDKQLFNKSINFINESYDNLTYFDLYGGSVFLFILCLLVVALIVTYTIVMRKSDEIKTNWVQERCNPTVIPFAGFINKPDDKSISEFTHENFTFCTQSILTNITGYAVSPFNGMLSGLVSIFNEFSEALNNIRKVISKLRTGVSSIAENVMSRILNIIPPLLEFFIAFIDSMNKTQGIMTAGLYTTLGAYLTLQTLIGSIVEIVIKIMVALAIVISVLAVFPPSWPLATSFAAVFSIYVAVCAIVLTFMKQALGMKNLPGLPKLKKVCFDKDVMLKMNDGTKKRIIDIQVGDILQNKNVVTAKLQLDATNEQMYKINNVIVSSSHLIKKGESWIPVEEYPNKQKVEYYLEPFIYCLNTSNKLIEIDGLTFSDWDEAVDDELERLMKNNFINYDTKKIHTMFEGGYVSETLIELFNGKQKSISEIKINDILKSGEKVYGIVEINGKDLDIFEYYLGNKKVFGGINNVVNSEDFGLTTTSNLVYISKTDLKQDKLYHILTNTTTFSINNQIVKDYNSCIDFI